MKKRLTSEANGPHVTCPLVWGAALALHTEAHRSIAQPTEGRSHGGGGGVPSGHTPTPSHFPANFRAGGGGVLGLGGSGAG